MNDWCPRMQDFAVCCLERWLGFPVTRKGARKALRDALIAEDEDYSSLLQHGVRQPDGWFMVPRNAQLIHPAFRSMEAINADRYIWIEVEDTNKLALSKLDWYADLWFDCDSSMTVDFQVATTDRYGRDFRFVDLQAALLSRRSTLSPLLSANGWMIDGVGSSMGSLPSVYMPSV